MAFTSQTPLFLPYRARWKQTKRKKRQFAPTPSRFTACLYAEAIIHMVIFLFSAYPKPDQSL